MGLFTYSQLTKIPQKPLQKSHKNPSKKIMSTKRGKAYEPPLDICLCHAYLVVSQDPVVGSSQTNAIFWNRILDEYTRSSGETRTTISLQNRWREIQRSCNKWRGFFKSVEARNQSGQTEADKVKLIVVMFFIF